MKEQHLSFRYGAGRFASQQAYAEAKGSFIAAVTEQAVANTSGSSKVCPSLARKHVNVLGDKERQIFEGLFARTMLQWIRTDLFGYDPHPEVWQWRDGPSSHLTLLGRARAQSQEGNHSLA